MNLDINQMQKLRKRLNLTQKEFAQKAGISQSMVAKIESGKLDPTYSKVRQIEQALQHLMNKDEKQAKDIMIKDIISVSPGEPAKNIVKLIQKNNISQIPVIEKGNVLGLITESSLLAKSNEEIQNAKAREVMEDSPPIITPSTSIEVIKQLLLHYPIIIVKDKGHLSGLITKADLLESLIKN